MYLAGDLTTPFRLRDVSGGGLSFPFQLRHITSQRRRDTFQRQNAQTVRRRPLALGCMPPTRWQPPQAEPWTAVARRSRDTAWGWARVLNNQETKDTN